LKISIVGLSQVRVFFCEAGHVVGFFLQATKGRAEQSDLARVSLDPAIYPLAKKMDPRVKPAGDGQ